MFHIAVFQGFAHGMSVEFTNISLADYDKTSTFFYAGEGSILFFFNSFFVCRFLSSKHYRAQKDSLLIVGYLIFDTLFGLTYMCSGIYRIILIYAFSYEYFPALTKWECIETPALLFVIITPTAGIIVFVTALDRCFVAMYPLKYLQLNVRYAIIVICIPYVIALVPIIKALLGSYFNRFVQNESAACNLENALTREDFTILRLVRVVLTLSCIVIYIPVTIKMYQGVINIIIFVATQRSFRQVILGRSATSMIATSIRIVGKPRHSFEVGNGSSGKSTKAIVVKCCTRLPIPVVVSTVLTHLRMTLKFTNVSIADFNKTSAFVYTVEGGFLFAMNLFLVCRYLSNKKYRSQKDSLLIVGYLIFDTIFGLTYLCSGLYRILLVYAHAYKYFPISTKWGCIGTPAILFIVITPTAGIYAFVTALDRCYVAMFPFKYPQLNVRYALVVMFIPYVIALAPIIKALIGTYRHRYEEVNSLCLLEDALTRQDFNILRILRVVLTLSCVIIYVPVTIRMYQNIRAHQKLANNTGGRSQKRLLRMTITIFLVTSNTIFMFTIPDLILLSQPNFGANIFYILNLNKGVVNILIFIATQKSVRQIVTGKSRASVAVTSIRIGRRINTYSDRFESRKAMFKAATTV
ncbi:unnamed protein product [Cylicocyclus nassatus]|uniref:G-protein coupled receptors family 1 profile domain-containing protein n=1 Tax=Cylicocyclus nassatus TaxID=53992 RepID=A0AA36MHU4_CYLNA|nr:unnamed protein product [Cylicocyclus nassatus]